MSKTTIRSIIWSKDNEQYISYKDLKVYLLDNINDLRKTGDAFDGLQADILQKTYDAFVKAWN